MSPLVQANYPMLRECGEERGVEASFTRQDDVSNLPSGNRGGGRIRDVRSEIPVEVIGFRLLSR